MAAEHWYVLEQGDEKPKGPYTVDSLAAGLQSGSFSTAARVNKAGSDQWVNIGQVAGAPNASVPSASPSKTGANNKRLGYVLVSLLALLILEVGGVATWEIVQQRKIEEARRQERETDREEETKRREEERAEQRGRLVGFETTTNECFSTINLATCHVTNFSDETITVCMQGVLMQKEAAGVRLYSMPMCTGPVKPLETMQVSAPWDGGNATNVCHDARGFLEWANCNFNVIDHKPKPGGGAK